MTIEKVKLTDFTTDELQAVYIALGVALETCSIDFLHKHSETIETFQTQIINAVKQREREEKIIQN